MKKSLVLTCTADINELINENQVSELHGERNGIEMIFLLFQGGVVLLNEDLYNNLLSAICNLARSKDLEIVTGSIFVERDNKVFEQSLFVDYMGNVNGIVQKEYDDAQLTHAKQFEIYESRIGKIGIVLGKDLWNIEIPRIMALNGAEILFVPDLRHNENECSLEHIRGISIFNSMIILYARQKSEGQRILYAIPGDICADEVVLFSETRQYEIERSVVEQVRTPDYTFRNTMWWLLWGRKPQNYKEILNKYLDDSVQ